MVDFRSSGNRVHSAGLTINAHRLLPPFLSKKQAAQGEALSGLLAKSSGEEGKLFLHRRRTSLSGGGRGALIALRVAHQVHIDTAILTPALSGLVRLDRFVLAQSDYVNLVGGHTVLRSQILNHSIGTALA